MNADTASRVIFDFGTARVVQGSRDYELVVQRRGEDGQWQDVTHYNEMSDDYAYTNARRAAESYARSYP